MGRKEGKKENRDRALGRIVGRRRVYTESYLVRARFMCDRIQDLKKKGQNKENRQAVRGQGR